MKNESANPSPLGALGFGMTTVLYSILGAGFFAMNSMLLSMALFLGGAAQIIAGLLEYRRGNTFGFTAFTMFGFFWWTLVSLSILPILGVSTAPSAEFMAWFNLLWTVFAIILFIATLKKDTLTKSVFCLVVFLFGFLSLHNFTGFLLFGRIAGWVGILCGSGAIFSAAKQLVKE